MTRKDYIAIAAIMAQAMPIIGDRKYRTSHAIEQARRAQWEHDCSKLCEALSADNPRFDEVRFLTACRYYEDRP